MTEEQFHRVILGVVTADVLPVVQNLEEMITAVHEMQGRMIEGMVILEARIAKLEQAHMRASGVLHD